MKTLNICAALLFSIFTLNFSFAQEKTDAVKVSGNCEMCKKKIEKAAKLSGATYASWNEETKMLNLNYLASNTSLEKIEKAIAAAGYDTQNFKASDKAYNKLMKCCQYERTTSFNTSKIDCKNDCCKDKSCCSKDGKCSSACKDMPECKDMACCKS